MAARIVTEETIGDLLADGALTPGEFGLRVLEVRRYGACHPSEYSPCDHGDDTCSMVQDTYRTDGTGESGEPHCDQTCPNLWDIGGATEGIGGEYAAGGTFSYISDDHHLSDRVWARAVEVTTQSGE